MDEVALVRISESPISVRPASVTSDCEGGLKGADYTGGVSGSEKQCSPFDPVAYTTPFKNTGAAAPVPPSEVLQPARLSPCFSNSGYRPRSRR